MPKNTRENSKKFRQDRFLEKYVRYCVVGRAARAAGVTRRTVELWDAKEEAFAARYKDTKKDVLEILEREALRRATKGVNEPVFYKGQVCGIVKKYSDTLLIVLLKANAPEKYRERYELTGKDGEPIAIKEVEVRLSGN